jgi:hypothetical protein
MSDLMEPQTRGRIHDPVVGNLDLGFEALEFPSTPA